MSRSRRKKRRNRSRRAGLTLSWSHLEIARGHDGLLRGKPEPVIVSAVYQLSVQQARLGGRWIHRCQCADNRFPANAPLARPAEDAKQNVTVSTSGNSVFLLLWLAIEDDNGNLVQEAYAKLERVKDIFLCPVASIDPAPLFLSYEGIRDLTLREPFALDLLIEGQHLSEQKAGDDWVGCMAAVFPADKAYFEDLRVHFLSADERNDWTLPATIRYRSPKG